MDGNGINPHELTPDDIQLLRLRILQLCHPELFQDQLLQDDVPPPPQLQPHTYQQPSLAEGNPSRVLGPPVYDMLGNQPDNVAPPPGPQPQSYAGQEPFQVGEDPSRVLDPSEYSMVGNRPDNMAPPPQPQAHTGQGPFLAGGYPSGVLGPLEYRDSMVGNQPDNVAPPPQPQVHIGQGPFPPGEYLSGVLDPSAFGMAGNQPVLPPPPYPSQVDASLAMGGDDLKHNPQRSVTPPVQDQAAGPDPPADASQQHPCPICGRIFKRPQERDRHLWIFLPQWIYCPFSRSNCPFRSHRRDNLVSHWKKEHANSGQVLPGQKQQYQIYDPDPLVALVVSGQMSMELAAETALPSVEMRAQELGKGDVWARNWWGRHPKPHRDQQ